MVRGALQYAARKSEDLHAPLIDLQRQQRLERSALIEIARKKGLSKQEAKIAVTLAQQVQYFELQRDILAAEDARVAAWRKEQEEMLRVHPLPWSPDPPILARASRDDKSLDYWAHEVERRSDQEFVAWLESSRLPPLRRPSGVPDFDELLTLGVAQQRIRQIAWSYLYPRGVAWLCRSLRRDGRRRFVQVTGELLFLFDGRRLDIALFRYGNRLTGRLDGRLLSGIQS